MEELGTVTTSEWTTTTDWELMSDVPRDVGGDAEGLTSAGKSTSVASRVMSESFVGKLKRDLNPEPSDTSNQRRAGKCQKNLGGRFDLRATKR